MKIERSAIIIYGSSDKKRAMENNKLKDYKNERYIEIMQDILSDYDEILVADKNNTLYEHKDVCDEEKVIRCIYKELKKIKNEKALVISSEMPLINKKLVNYMGTINFDEDILIPYADKKLQNLCAVYNKNMLKVLQDIIENEKASFVNLFSNISMRYVFPKDKSIFMNINKLEKYITYYM